MSALSAFVYTISEKRDKKATDLKKKKKKQCFMFHCLIISVVFSGGIP